MLRQYKISEKIICNAFFQIALTGYTKKLIICLISQNKIELNCKLTNKITILNTSLPPNLL